MSLGLCLVVTLFLDLSGNPRERHPRKACIWDMTLAGYLTNLGSTSGPCLMVGSTRDVQDDVSTAEESLDQHLTQVGLSQEEIRLVISSPYHQFVSLGAQACR